VIIDVNLLIFATFENTVQHRVAREWVKAHFNNSIRVGLPQFVLDCLNSCWIALEPFTGLLADFDQPTSVCRRDQDA